MYYKKKRGWSKHLDFIVADLACLQFAFLVAYWIRHGISSPYQHSVYRNEVVVLLLIQVLVSIFSENFKNVLKRGYYVEFAKTCKQVFLVTGISICYLFLVKNSEAYSRMTMLFMGGFYLVFSYPVRLVLKSLIKRKLGKKEGKKSLLLLTTSERVEALLQDIKKQIFHDYRITGIVLLDQDRKGEIIGELEVVENAADVVNYVCRSWVDEIYIDVNGNDHLTQEMLNSFNEMGVTVHLKLQGMDNPFHRLQYVEKIMGNTVMTYSVNNMSEANMAVKRLMDILGGIVGCLLTVVLTIIIGPMIYVASPGPIYFSQDRVGQNGKVFKIYKFRSMYLDAEERKKELMEQNEVSGGMMFKMENDPRIIKGIGHFIRKTSLDEFPQFWNVLKGDMSLVGTRPPTVDEWVKYDLHHRLRMAIKPGITGMWQVSGRSDVKEFEEVVKLDAEYIAKWNIGLDVKIILKTVGVMVNGDGAR